MAGKLQKSNGKVSLTNKSQLIFIEKNKRFIFQKFKRNFGTQKILMMEKLKKYKKGLKILTKISLKKMRENKIIKFKKRGKNCK